MDRRSFLKISTMGLAGLSLPVGKLAAMAPGVDRRGVPGGKYSVVILGDTHYDSPNPELYHAGYTDPDPVREAAHRKEFARNGIMWSGRCKDLVRRAACLMDEDTRFVYQVGDLIQGDTADAETHKRFLADTMNYFKSELAPDLPFVTVAGNHDLRGNDDAVCVKAYNEYMTARMSQELGQEVTSPNFLFQVGPDAYVVISYRRPKIKEINSLLEQARGARHVFVLIHTPVFPYDDEDYYFWFFLGGRDDAKAEERRRMRALLASLNAIVLCGHTHATEFLDWRGDGGRITQMTMSSVWSYASRRTYKVLASGAKGYGSLLFKKNPALLDGPAVDLFDEYRAGIRAYSISDSAGSYKMVVDGRKVYVDFYAGDASRRSARFTLR